MPASSLAGMLALILLIASVLTALITASLLRQYGRAVLAMSRQRVTADDSPTLLPLPTSPLAAGPAPSPARPDADPTPDAQRQSPHQMAGAVGSGPSPQLSEVARLDLRRARWGPWMSALVYSAAGLGYALLITLAWSVNSEAFGRFPLAVQITIFVLVVWIYCWPIVLTLNVVTAATLRQQWARYLLYGAGLLLLTAGGLTTISTFLAVAIAVPTLVALALLQQGVRIVAPLVFVYMVVWISAIRIVAGLVTMNADQALVVEIVGAIGVGALAISGYGWRTLAPIDWLYRRKLISDESLVVDAVWLSYTLFVMTEFSVFGTVWAVVVLGCFISYKLVALAGFAIVGHLSGPKRNHRLLLLRVFGSDRRSERLLAKLGTRWRHIGSIQLIIGADLAVANLEPHALLEFARGRLADRYITSQEDLERRLHEVDLEPDGDGRFRVNDFFCYADTWRMILSRLVVNSDVVLMDARGFSRSNRGCAFELDALRRLGALGRTVVIVDRATDRHYLNEILDAPPSSALSDWLPTHAGGPEAQVRRAWPIICHLDRDDRPGMMLLLASLCQVAAPTSAASATAVAAPAGP
jgi:hypothetical protein